jgi:hypothetical protein
MVGSGQHNNHGAVSGAPWRPAARVFGRAGHHDSLIVDWTNMCASQVDVPRLRMLYALAKLTEFAALGNR